MAKFFTAGGVRSMAAPPTAATGDALRPADPGDELADTERDPGHQQADNCPAPGRGRVRMVSHRVYS